MSGWIKYHRDIKDHWIAQDPLALALWSWLLIEANFSPKTKMFNKQLVRVERGQLIFGIHAFNEKTGISASTIRRVVKQLETDNMINKQSFSKYSIITITNYDDYQSDDKQTTSRPQAKRKQTTTPKEGEEGKEGKEGKDIKLSKKDFEEWFDKFWISYPRNKDKAESKKKLQIVINGGDNPEDILHGAKEYAHEVKGKEEQYIKRPPSWINKKGWEDYTRPVEDLFTQNQDDVSDEDAKWITAMTVFIKNGSWARSIVNSSPPDHPDTRVPEHILKQFGMEIKL